MTDFDRAGAGPQLGAPNWPLAELDELNPGLDPTQMDDRDGRAKATAEPQPRRASPDEISRAAEDSHPRDDADPHLSGARPSRRRSRSARPRRSAMSRPTSPRNITASPARRSTARSGSAARSASRRRRSASSSRSCAQLLRPCRPRIYAHQRPRGAPFPAGADGSAEDAEIRFTPEGKQAILDQGRCRRSSGRNSSPANMSAPSASASTAARAWSRRSRR